MKTFIMHNSRESRFEACNHCAKAIRNFHSLTRRKRVLTAFALQVGFLLVAFSSASAAPRLSIPLFDGLGRHHHPVTTKWPLAQRYFDQGYTLCYNFNHAEAVRAFEAAATVDPECAMA